MNSQRIHLKNQVLGVTEYGPFLPQLLFSMKKLPVIHHPPLAWVRMESVTAAMPGSHLARDTEDRYEEPWIKRWIFRRASFISSFRAPISHQLKVGAENSTKNRGFLKKKIPSETPWFFPPFIGVVWLGANRRWKPFSPPVWSTPKKTWNDQKSRSGGTPFFFFQKFPNGEFMLNLARMFRWWLFFSTSFLGLQNCEPLEWQIARLQIGPLYLFRNKKATDGTWPDLNIGESPGFGGPLYCLVF